MERLARGGYPEAVARPRPERRRAFFDAYVASLLTRDVRDIANIEDPGALRRLLHLAATRSGGLLNHSELARTLGLPVSTLKRYLALLEALFLVRLIPAWATNRGKRLVRAPKFHLVDTGLLLTLAGLPTAALEQERTFLGSVLESFVAGELNKQLGWSKAKPVLHHFRSHGGHEVDLVLEDERGRIVGVEVKASATVHASDLNGLRALTELAGRSWVQGVVLHLGTGSVAFGPGLTACPIDTLWA
jgi:predicted AAA+ superfamily ATPase